MSLVEELDHLVKVRKIVEIVRLGNDDSAQTRLRQIKIWGMIGQIFKLQGHRRQTI